MSPTTNCCIPSALTIAGSDPSGGAGIQADIKTFQQFSVFGMSVVTLVTAQNTREVSRVEILSEDLVLAQLDAVLSDIPPTAAKTGALGNASIVKLIAERAKTFLFPLVVDPVMVSKHGMLLLDSEAVAVVRDYLLPVATLLTPNIPEAAMLTGFEIHDEAGMLKAAKRLCELGAKNVLLKGGHLQGSATDILYSADISIQFPQERIHSNNTHGTGCVYSAAITALLARGHELPDAVSRAKKFVTNAIRTAPHLGTGFGPINLLFSGL